MTALWAPAQRKAEVGRDPPPLPWDEWLGYAPQESVKFGDSSHGCVPEIKTLGPRLGEHSVQTETRETRVIDCFSLRAHWSGGCELFSSGARDGVLPFSSCPSVLKAFREQNRATQCNLKPLTLSKGGTFPQGKDT